MQRLLLHWRSLLRGQLLYATGNGVAPFLLQLPLRAAQSHAGGIHERALVGDLATAGIIPGVEVGIGNRFRKFMRIAIGNRPRSLAEGIAREQIARIAPCYAAGIGKVGDLDVDSVAGAVVVPCAVVHVAREVRGYDCVESGRIRRQVIRRNRVANLIDDGAC